MDFKFYFCCLLLLVFLFNGCAYVPGLKQFKIVKSDYSDSAIQIKRDELSEDLDKDFSPHKGRRFVSDQDQNQQNDQMEKDPFYEPFESGEIKAVSDSSSDPLFTENSSISAIDTAIEPAVEIDPIQVKQDKLDEALGICQEAQVDWKEGNVEMALELLDRAYELLINVETNGDAEIFQQKEDIRFLISKRIVEIYASRQTMVNGNHNEIPLIMNDIVEREIKSFLGQEKEFFLASYSRSGKYRQMILDELKKAGLPERLSWLPLIESGFLIRALSRARALGLWQFIPSTGYKFGLERNRWIDERMDPEKATKAAIEYLTQLHNIFGDWTTALAAYNCGEGTVLRVIRNQHINYLDNFWDLYVQLPSETARYVPRLMAALHLIENPEKYGLDLPVPQEPVIYDEITVKKQILLSDLAEKISVSKEELIDMNPELRYKVTPDSEYTLKVPPNKSETALAVLEEMPAWRAPEPEYAYHRVRKGETLSHIARRYRTSVKKIASINNIRSYKRLRIGQRLKIPVRGRGSNTLTKASPGGGYKTVSVRKGDCSYDIARMYGMSLNEFLSVNNLSKRSVIYPGQRVLVRSK
ncbi:MAG: LysM peptidoglycan-binding domain-containing protein [bacterium]